MNLIDSLSWRYATKKFDSNRIVSKEIVAQILTATNLTASSYGLQPFKFVVIQDKDLQSTLVEHSYNQNQVAEASHVIVIATRTDVDSQYIGRYVDYAESQRELSSGTLDGFRKAMNATIIDGMSNEQQKIWAEKQAYIALGTMLAACASLEVDACPMEGFVPKKYDELLDLASKNLRSCVVVPIGYRAEDDKYQHLKKIRQPLDEIVVELS